MKVDILCVGKIKENFTRDALAEYLKRLGRYAKVEIIEVADEPTPEGASAKEEEQIKAREGARLLAKMSPQTHVIALAIEGRELSSEEFAAHIENLTTAGKSHIQFVIGGSLGLSDEVLTRADFKLSFGKMTFPHQIMRVVLLEQIYRAHRIINHEPYHK